MDSIRNAKGEPPVTAEHQVKTYTVTCPCGATSGPLSLSDAMRWGAVHHCDEVGPS